MKRYAKRSAEGILPKTVWFGDKPLFARGSKYRGQPIVLSEVGGFLAIPPDIPAEKRDMLYQFYDSFQTPQELLDKYRDLMKGFFFNDTATTEIYTLSLHDALPI